MLVIINSLLQIVLYAPMALFFINVISGTEDFALDYSDTAQSVAIVSARDIPLCVTCSPQCH